MKTKRQTDLIRRGTPLLNPTTGARSAESTARGLRRADGRRLLNELDTTAVDHNVVTAVAGDIEPDASLKKHIATIRRRRGRAFYSDLLFAVSHRFFPPDQAKDLWRRIVRHKTFLHAALGRNVGVVVAAVDYLTNIQDLLDAPSVIDAHRIAQVVEVALCDGLTGLLDHTTFKTKLASELRRFERYGDGFCLMMLDIDDFKAVNDSHGHLYGDEVLASIATIVRDTVRETDVAARYGGEEFAVLAPRSSIVDATGLAERICSAVHDRFEDSDQVTVSIGVAGCQHNAESATSLIRRADRALYRAKAAGKDRVIVDARNG